MQLTPNSLKFLVASIILNEVERKNIIVEDLFFIFNVKRTPTKPGIPKGQFSTFYLSASENFYMFSGSAAVDKDWDSSRELLVISSDFLLSAVNGPRRASTAPISLLLINSPWVKMIAFISTIIDSFYNFLFLKTFSPLFQVHLQVLTPNFHRSVLML